MPLPRRWLTSLMTRYNGSSILIDCGEGTQIAIREKGWSFKPIDVICFTHFHADHIAGLPGLLLTMGNAERTEPLTIIGPRGVERIVSSMRSIAPELPFDINFIELTEPFGLIEINGYIIKAFKVNHNVICYGYTIEIPRAGKFDVDRAISKGIPKMYWNKLQKGEIIETEGKQFTPDMVMGEPRKGIKLTYCTDTRPTRSIIENSKSADLLICEGMYGEKGKEKKAQEYKHMTFYEAADIAKEAAVNELWLTHFSPSLVNPEEFMNDVRAVFPNSKAGKDGKTVIIDFPKE